MRFTSICLHAVAGALCVMALAGAATAAQVSRIDYAVIGGGFNGPKSGGAITGGTVTLTPLAGTITTPAYSTPMRVHVVLVGPAGNFTAWLAPGPTMTMNITSNGLTGGTTFTGPTAPFRTGTKIYSGDDGAMMLAATGGTGLGTVAITMYPLNHAYVIGGEVRTGPTGPVVPAIPWLGRVALLGLLLVAGPRGGTAGALGFRRE